MYDPGILAEMAHYTWRVVKGLHPLSVAENRQIHEYAAGKNLLFTVATLFAMLVMIFILMIFFSMISQGVSYFISLGKELLFRL